MGLSIIENNLINNNKKDFLLDCKVKLNLYM